MSLADRLLLNTLVLDRVSLIILATTLGAQVFRRSLFVQYLKTIWRISVLGIFGILFYWCVRHYQAWQVGFKYLLPPYQSFGYYYQYVGSRFVAPWLISLLAAFLIRGVAEYLNGRFGERFFETEEISLISLGTFLTGYPGFLFYFVFIFAAELLLSLFYSVTKRGRAPLYYLWLPLAIFAIIIRNWLLPTDFLSLFNI